MSSNRRVDTHRAPGSDPPPPQFWSRVRGCGDLCQPKSEKTRMCVSETHARNEDKSRPCLGGLVLQESRLGKAKGPGMADKSL